MDYSKQNIFTSNSECRITMSVLRLRFSHLVQLGAATFLLLLLLFYYYFFFFNSSHIHTQNISDANMIFDDNVLSTLIRMEGNVLFNDALNTYYLRLYGVRHNYGKGPLSKREETRCRHMRYSFRIIARVLLYVPFHRQDSTYHDLYYTSRGALTGTRNSSMGPL